MADTKKQEAFTKDWFAEQGQDARIKYLRGLLKDAGLEKEMSVIHDVKLATMDPDKYMINVLALAKIKQLRRIADYQEMQCPV